MRSSIVKAAVTAALGALIATQLVNAQPTVSDQPQDNAPERYIADFLNSDIGVLGGVMIKQVAGIGDRAAVAITKTIGARGFKPTDTGRILDILDSSFRATPENEADRMPATALFVLTTLERMPQSQQDYRDIEALKSRLESQLNTQASK